MNKKKIFFAIVAVLILSFSCLAFTACNKTSDIDDFGKQLKDAQSGEIVTSVGFFGVEMTNTLKYDGNKMWNSAVLTSSETYFETVGTKTYAYTQDSNGVWQKRKFPMRPIRPKARTSLKTFLTEANISILSKKRLSSPKKAKRLAMTI